MSLQSITRTLIPGVNLDLDQRTYRDVWPILRLNEASVVQSAARLGSNSKATLEIVPIGSPVAGLINVAIIDSGIPDGESSGAYNRPIPRSASPVIVNNGQDRDEDDHATYLAATIRGPNKDSAPNLHFGKSFSAQGWPTPARGAHEITSAARLGAPRVIVLAWDVGHTTPELRKAIRAVRDTAVVVIAAGNWSLDNDKRFNWPANYGRENEMDHVITVMATDEHDERAYYSSYGAKSVYIAAPGLAILKPAQSSSPLRTFGSLRDSHRRFRGTSAATAHVARLAALVLANNPTWSPQEVKQHIGKTARKVKTLTKRGVRGVEKLCETEAIVDFAKALELK